jgi:hypothetical protein
VLRLRVRPSICPRPPSPRRTISTVSCDIPYSARPTAASARGQVKYERIAAIRLPGFREAPSCSRRSSRARWHRADERRRAHGRSCPQPIRVPDPRRSRARRTAAWPRCRRWHTPRTNGGRSPRSRLTSPTPSDRRTRGPRADRSTSPSAPACRRGYSRSGRGTSRRAFPPPSTVRADA